MVFSPFIIAWVKSRISCYVEIVSLGQLYREQVADGRNLAESIEQTSSDAALSVI
jgi:hypothetical protein